VISRHRHNLVE